MSDELQQHLLGAEDKLSSCFELSPQDKNLLLALITYAPGIPQRINVCHEIASCGDASALTELARLYRDIFLTKFLAAGARTPKVSDHPSRPSFDDAADAFTAQSESPYRQQGVIKTKVHARDGLRCVVTGRPDKTVAAAVNHPLGWTKLVAAHIIPFSIGMSGPSQAERDGVGQIWAIMQRFGGISLDELNGTSINRLENVMTLSTEAHDLFGTFAIWLEPEENPPNTYRLKKSDAYCLPHLPDGLMITLTAHSTSPLPNRRYLALHAACARVMHATGLVEVIEKIIRDCEDLTVLSSDGSSAELLKHALNMVSVC